jgi:hypothetical protein
MQIVPRKLTGSIPASGSGESLVDYIPRVAATSPVGDEVGDVVLEDGDHSGVRNTVGHEGGEPCWVLVVPAEVVAAEVFAVVLGDVDGNVTTGVVKDALLGLGELPLHVVGRGDFTEYTGVVEDGHVLGVVLLGAGNICSSTEPKLASRLGNVVEEWGTIGGIVGELVDGDISGVDAGDGRRDGGSRHSCNGSRSDGELLEGRHVEDRQRR